MSEIIRLYGIWRDQTIYRGVLRRRKYMLVTIEDVLYPIVVEINNYLSSYILIFLLIGVGIYFPWNIDVKRFSMGAYRCIQLFNGNP